MQGLHRCRDHVFEEGSGLFCRRRPLSGKFARLLLRNGKPTPGEPSRSSRHLVRTHNSMLSKSTVVPPTIALYNQGNIDGGIVQGTVGPVVASDEVEKRPSRKGQNVEERLKTLMQDLGNAINESLSDSERIAEAIGEIKRAGYDVFLVLEATIGFNKRDENDEGPEEADLEEPQEIVANGRVRFTTQDQRFLKALRIAVDEEA